MAYAIEAFFGNGGTSAYVLRAFAGTSGTASRDARGIKAVKVTASSPGSWGTRVHLVYLASTDGDASRFRIVVVLKPLGKDKQIVEDWDRLSADPGDESYVVDVLQRSLYVRWDPGTAPARPDTFDLDGTVTEAQILDASVAMTGGTGGDAEVADGAFPARLAVLDEITDASLLVITPVSGAGKSRTRHGIAYAETRPQRDLFFIGDLQRHHNPVVNTALGEARAELAELPASDHAAIYWPWVVVSDPVGAGRDPVQLIPPSAFVAGLYSRTDGRRGVWKAPAGVEATLLGIRGIDLELEREVLREPKYSVGPDIEHRLNQVGVSHRAEVTLTAHWYSPNTPADWRLRLAAWARTYVLQRLTSCRSPVVIGRPPSVG